ncbi:MAG: 4-(cytidine 5'-diphospho)-2-C-methyl-D-erythritol kinase [Verrucomicrobiota bacterium]
MEERAHAKVNLSLRVLRKREDGFHEIETVMAPITLCDLLHFAPAADFFFQCSAPDVPSGEDNLVVRAARLFFAETKLEPKVAITLTKRIPHGAGLGGGSSDAAATLRGLNRFFDTQLSEEEMKVCAETLGSDVPFFLRQRAAICCGRGELITFWSLPKTIHLVLLKPAFGVPTPWAYSRWSATRERPQEEANAFGITFLNDLEEPVFARFPFLQVLKDWLRAQEGVKVAQMSGSGSTVFAVMEDGSFGQGLVARARAELDPELWTSASTTLGEVGRPNE